MTFAAILILASNLLPLAGVLFWGWDVFVLLILYWLETLVIGFWTIVRILLPPNGPPAKAPATLTATFAGRIVLAAFTTVHAGIFMAAHFFFLWVFFAGPWARRISSVTDFWDELIIGSDLWGPLLFLFLVRGWQVLGPRLWRGLATPDLRESPQGIVPGGLYIRIVIMQVAIIFGGWVAFTLGGSTGALILLVALKTLVDVFFDSMARKSPAAGAAASRTAH